MASHDIGKVVGEAAKAATGKDDDGFNLKGFLSGITFGFIGVGSKDEIPGFLKSYISPVDELKFLELVHKLTKSEQKILWHFIDYAFPRVRGDAVTNARVNHAQNAFRSFVLNYAKKKAEAKTDDHNHPPAPTTPPATAHAPTTPSPTPAKVEKEDSPLLLLKRIVKTIKEHSNVSEREGLKKAYEYLDRADAPLGREIVTSAVAFVKHVNSLEREQKNPKGFWAWLASKITI